MIDFTKRKEACRLKFDNEDRITGVGCLPNLLWFCSGAKQQALKSFNIMEKDQCHTAMRHDGIRIGDHFFIGKGNRKIGDEVSQRFIRQYIGEICSA